MSRRISSQANIGSARGYSSTFVVINQLRNRKAPKFGYSGAPSKLRIKDGMGVLLGYHRVLLGVVGVLVGRGVVVRREGTEGRGWGQG